MTIGTINNSATYTPASLQTAAQPDIREAKNTAATGVAKQNDNMPASQTKVSISDQARQLQADDAAAQKAQRQTAEEDIGDKAEAFAYGALGMDHPDEVKANSDGFYNAGQWLAAAGTVATVLLAVA
ncbi:hypothetical protein [Photobacterium lutimaris]|uniref:Uncharacterized protein n=1 Tax=Photobacterium lutimaris TaxID=388278 RepID=A0A2T3IWV2_9GAMM|nr:hypothetical protein [Photobacterium lutimaris]PSU32949.1 hypothetical protein C9I99_15195 [Photobacterium lutimaris]TDR74065.1 hypothetical protein DFP78_109124 [Photobacterium lutimaris]